MIKLYDSVYFVDGKTIVPGYKMRLRKFRLLQALFPRRRLRKTQWLTEI